jgi:hypothetical protein
MNLAMKETMQRAMTQFMELLEEDEITRGMFVRMHGDHLIAGRNEPLGSNGELQEDDRVRLTRLRGQTYGLSVKRHTGRWERTPFTGSIQDMVQTIRALMQHLVAPF